MIPATAIFGTLGVISRVAVPPGGLPRWALCTFYGEPLHAFPAGMDMQEIAAHLAVLGLRVDQRTGALNSAEPAVGLVRDVG